MCKSKLWISIKSYIVSKTKFSCVFIVKQGVLTYNTKIGKTIGGNKPGEVLFMELNQEIIDITDAIKNEVPVERIYLFGSYAKGTPDDTSDYDFFLLIPDDGMRPLDAAFRARRALSAVKRKTPVDIITDYRSRFEERRHLNTLERRIWNEGVVLYERA